MKHLSWIEAARDLDCIRCRVAGRSGTMTRKFHQEPLNECAGCGVTLSRGVKFCPECGVKVSNATPPVVVEFICEEPGCGDHRGPYIVDTEDSPAPAAAPEPAAPITPTPAEVEKYSAPEPAPKRSRSIIEKPPEPIAQADLIDLCKEKFPKTFEMKNDQGALVMEFPLRVSGITLPGEINGVKVCYGQPGPYRAPGQLQAVMRLDVIEETLWCDAGEPDAAKIEETITALEAAIKNSVRGVPTEIHKVVHRPTGPASVQVCGVCNNRLPCGCGTVLKASSMSADPVNGSQAPNLSVAEFIRRPAN